MKKLLTLTLLLVATQIWAAMIIETIQLQNRPSEEVIPLVQPMLAPGASITGTGYKLIIKSTPENISQIQALIEEIDINQNQLRVYVSMGKQTNRSEQHGSVSVATHGDIGSVVVGSDENTADGDLTITDGKTKFNARIYQTETSKNKPAVQVMTVAEGYWASISVGQSIPIAARTRNPDGTVTEVIHYQKIMTGYSVMPRTHGNQVTLTIRPIQQSSTDPRYATIESTELETTVTGKLGEWLYLGGTDQEENLKSSGITYQTRIRSTDVNQVWVKVERP